MSRRTSMIKAKSDISFREYNKKICQATQLQSGYGFYYDIESNVWYTQPCSICDCDICKETSDENLLKIKQMRHKRNLNVKKVDDAFSWFNFIFVFGTFCGSLVIFSYFA